MIIQILSKRIVAFLAYTILLTITFKQINAQICDYSDEFASAVSILQSNDGFESYTNTVPTNNFWSVFPPSGSYVPVAATVVTSQQYCGDKSAFFKSSPSPTDMLYELNGNRINFRLKVPSGKSAKISFMNSSNTAVFAMLFGTDGKCRFYLGSGNTNAAPAKIVTYTQNQWMRISNYISGTDQAIIFFNYDNVATVTSANVNTITKLNIFANTFNSNPIAQSDNFYIDYVSNFSPGCCITCSAEFDPVCLNESNIEVGENGCYAMASGILSEEFHDCDGTGSGGSACEDAMPIDCGETVTGTTLGETFKFYRPDYGSCLPGNSSNDFRAPDKVYKFTKTDNSGDIGITLCSKKLNADLDVFLVDECGMAWSGNPQVVILDVPGNEPPNTDINCIASGTSAVDANGFDTDFIEYRDLPAGEYYIIIDGQHWQEQNQVDDAGPFELTLTCKDLDCDFSDPIQCNVPKFNEAMIGENNVSVYCSPNQNPSGSTDPLPVGAGCTGVERVYSFTPNISGPITITLSGFTSNEDLELFLLEDCDHTICLASSTNPVGQTETIIFNVDAGHTYQIVVDGYKGGHDNFDLAVNCCGTPQFVNCSTNGPISHYYSGDGNNLRYTFSSTVQMAPGYQWVVRQNGSVINNQAGTSTSTNIEFNNAGNYEVCFPRLNNQGCIEYCCYSIGVGNPFNCNTINYTYNSGNNAYNFTAQTNGTNGQWLVDNGNNAPTPIDGSLPVNGCVKRTISYRYFDGTFWRYCCRSIWICNPFTCNDITLGYKPSSNEYTFALSGNNNNWNNFSWTLDENNTNIGNSQVVIYKPNPNLPCQKYTYSIRYWDGTGWRLCCIPIYICDPSQCSSFVNHTYENNQLSLSTNSNFNNLTWYLNDNIIPPSSNQENGTYKICILYYDAVNQNWKVCCKEVSLGPDATEDINVSNTRVFPNPTNSLINVESDDEIKAIDFMDTKGQLIFSKSNNKLINVSDLSNGIYIIKVKTTKGVSRHKIIVSD